MANSDTPFGFKVHKCDPALIKKISVDSGTATAIFRGDLVKADTDGNVSVISSASDDYNGIVMSCFDSTGKELNYLPASTAGSVRLCMDPNAILEVQFEDGGTAPTAAAIFDCADAKWTHAGSTNTGQSGVELSETLVGDGNSAQFRILELIPRPGNVWGHYAKVLVQANEHALKAATVAI